MKQVSVLKFGGSSLGSHEEVIACARIAFERQQRGEHVVVVVSAMGSTTEQLIALGRSLGFNSQSSTHDLLISTGEQISAAAMALALSKLGQKATPLTGGEAGLITNSVHGQAELAQITPDRVEHELELGRIPVVMGFQGVTPDGTLTTLGRGGSDTTAVALAGALSRSWGPASCEVYTDVEGVHTSDPRLVTGTKPLDSIEYRQMRLLSMMGAQVMASRSIMHAEHMDVPVMVTSCNTSQRGTRIDRAQDIRSSGGVTACAMTDHLGRLQFSLSTECVNAPATMIRAACESGIEFLDFTHQTDQGGRNVVDCMADQDNIQGLSEVMLGACDTSHSEILVTRRGGLARIGLVGRALTQSAHRIHSAVDELSSHAIRPQSLSIDDEKCTFYVDSEQGPEALQRIHDGLGLSAETRRS